MRKYSEQICQKLESILCDICGESCKKEANNEVASLYAHWGYDSKKDLIRHNIDLCESCFDKTIQFLKEIRTLKLDGIDPLDGEEYSL